MKIAKLTNNKRFSWIIGIIYTLCLGYYHFAYQKNLVFNFLLGNVLGIGLVMMSHSMIKQIYEFRFQRLERFILTGFWGSLITLSVTTFLGWDLDIFLWAFWGIFYIFIEDPFEKRQNKRICKQVYLDQRDRKLGFRWFSGIIALLIGSVIGASSRPEMLITGVSILLLFYFVVVTYFTIFFRQISKSKIKWIYFIFIIIGFTIEMNLIAHQPFYILSMAISIFLWFGFFVYNEYCNLT